MLTVKEKKRYHSDRLNELSLIRQVFAGVLWFAQKLLIGLVVWLIDSKLKQSAGLHHTGTE